MSVSGEEDNLKLSFTDPVCDQRWDQFVAQHPDGKVYHCSAWCQVIAKTYSSQPCGVLAAKGKDDHLVEIMPMFYIDRWLSGKRLISLPFTTYCDPLMSPPTLRKAIAYLRDHFPASKYIQLRLLGYDPHELVLTTPPDEFVTHILDLHPDRDSIFNAFHSTSVRQRIRRAERIGLTFRLGDREEDLKIFYRLFTGVRKKHGLPPHPYSFFSNMWRFLEPEGFMKLVIVEHQGKPVSAAVLLLFGNNAHLEYSASDEKSMKLCANQKLIWECIKIAYDSDAKYFDFGRSAISNRSLVEFKERWGAKQRTLSYVTIPPQKKQQSEGGVAYRAITALNKRIPNWLLRLEGEFIYKKLSKS